MEAGVAVVEVAGGGLANNNGAQHQGGRVTHGKKGRWMDVMVIWPDRS